MELTGQPLSLRQGTTAPTLRIAFIDPTKAFDLVNRDGPFKILPKIRCPPSLLAIIRSFHENMKGTVVIDGSTSDPLDIRSGVKQVCVLALTLFGIFFAVLMKQAFGDATEGIYVPAGQVRRKAL